MRSVAWTDAIQGTVLMIGVITIFITINTEYGGFGFIYEQIEKFNFSKLIPTNSNYSFMKPDLS